MSPTVDADDLPLKEGAIAGAAAWIAGYVLTALIVLVRIEDSELGDIADSAGDSASGVDFVGWVFFNGHVVDTVIEGSVLGFGGSSAVSFVGGDGFTPLLYLIPVALLVGAGLAVGRFHGVTEVGDGAIVGALVVPPYLALSVVGAVVFRVSAAGGGVQFSGHPELLPAVLVAGVVFPAVCGAIGGIVAALRSPEQ